MKRPWVPISLGCLVVAAVVSFMSLRAGSPSLSGCRELWNGQANAVVRREATRQGSTGLVDAWDTKAGWHCSVHVFDRPGGPWAMYVLWLEAPDGPRQVFAHDVDGKAYGRGELGAEMPRPANAILDRDGRLSTVSEPTGD